MNELLSTDPDNTVNNTFYINSGGRVGFELGDIPFVNHIEPQTDAAFNFLPPPENLWAF
jgi:hypothetical protein